MEKTKLKIKDLLEDAKLTFLVGAGCSVDTPSCLAAGRTMMEDIIRYTCPDSEVENLNQLEDLRFEQLVEIIRDNLDPTLKLIDYYGLCDKPNLQHFFLADMIINGHIVLTTNFDFLIEHALLQLDVPKEKVKCIITKEDFENYSNPIQLSNEGFKPVYKIHGSTKNIITGEDTRDSLVATIQAFGSNKEGLSVFHVEPFKERLFDNVSNGRSLAIIGYSGSDDFDIVPTIKTMENLETLIWFNYVKDNKSKIIISKINPPKIYESKGRTDMENTFLTEMGGILAKSEFKHENGKLKKPEMTGLNKRLRKVYNILIDIGRAKNVKDIYRVDVNTTRLIEKLQKQNIKYVNKENFSYRPIDWFKKIIPVPNEFMKNTVSYVIYRELSKYNDALRCANNMLKIAESSDDTTLKMKAFKARGSIYYNQENSQEALEEYVKALRIAKSLGDKEKIAEIGYQVSLAYQALGEYSTALECIQITYDYYDEKNDLQGLALCDYVFGGLLLNGKMYPQSLEYYEKALDYYNTSGDLLKKVDCFYGIGLTYYAQGNKQKALQVLEDTLDIAKMLGNEEVISKICDKTTEVCFSVLEKSEAEKRAEKYKKGIQSKQHADHMAELERLRK